MNAAGPKIFPNVRRLLIFRLGSLGDTVVALPCFHLIARAFPNAERHVLTNIPVEGRAAPLAAVLGDSGLAQGYIRYPIGLRDVRALVRLRAEIRRFQPDALVYLTEARGPFATWRDVAFFKLCGVGPIYGAPLTGDLRRHRIDPESGLREAEASRLARCMAPLGDANLDDPARWDLGFTEAEQHAADDALAGWDGAGGFMAFSIGAKAARKDWGDANWRAVLSALAAKHPGLGLALIGAGEEAARSAALAADWPGPVRNLCGEVPPRVSALVIRRARIFIGHDSGPMHLAAATGTPSVVVFGDIAPPGVWFPHGNVHRVFYPGEGPDCGRAEDGIAAIRPDPIIAATDALLSARGAGQEEGNR